MSFRTKSFTSAAVVKLLRNLDMPRALVVVVLDILAMIRMALR